MIIKNKNNKNICSHHKVFEMAFSKKEYMGFIYNLSDQIAQNWCLCRYCYLYEPECLNYYHWKSELETLLNNLNRKHIDGDKLKWTKEAFINKEEFNNPEMVYNACRIKFAKEKNLNILLGTRKELCEDFCGYLDEIIECIASKNSIFEYTDSWFPNV